MCAMTENLHCRSVASRIDDARIQAVQELTLPMHLLEEMPITPAVAKFVCGERSSISRILSGEDPRLLVVVGPCSIHNVQAALDYAKWLLEFRRTVGDSLLIVMRVYFEKPRTRAGWKGLINDPYLDGSFRINDGLRLARKLLMEINTLGVPTATEFVDPITPQYIGDLISWAAIGARTAESQIHRELASGLSCPVGFKNGTTGDVSVAVNAVVAAQRAQHFLGITKSGQAAVVSTSGNPDCIVILRGGMRPNYDESSIQAAAALLRAAEVCPRVMVDCSHGNCRGDYHQQMNVAEDVIRQRRAGSKNICGLMVESNLLGGRQAFVAGDSLVPGLSITDPCLSIEDTARLLSGLVAHGQAVSWTVTAG
jgi:3-deoxy-7-phosphoheptulonate synthase